MLTPCCDVARKNKVTDNIVTNREVVKTRINFMVSQWLLVGNSRKMSEKKNIREQVAIKR